jgi:DNA-binding NarL/FixJ family response regulator
MLKVLIVDNDSELRKNIKEILVKALPLAQILDVADAETADKLVIENQQDIIITDLKLAGKSGLWLIERIRLRHQKISIIINSFFDTMEYRSAAHQFGADLFLSKKDNSINDVIDIIQAYTAA